MAAVGFDLYTRLLAEAVEERKARREGREPVREAPAATVDLPVDAHLPDDYVPDEAQKLELYRRLARARSAGDLAAFRQEVTRPLRADAARRSCASSRSPSCGWPPRPPASPPWPARRAGSSCASGRASRAATAMRLAGRARRCRACGRAT